jgi:hypothetical protein
MLNLSLQEYKKYREPVVQGFIKAAKILFENYIYTARDLPYNTQLIPMAEILAVLGDKIDNIGYKNKLMQWYRCGVFGELYGSANETRYALDLPQVINWIENDGPKPKTIYDANFSQDILCICYIVLVFRNIVIGSIVLRPDYSLYYSTAGNCSTSPFFTSRIALHICSLSDLMWCCLRNCRRALHLTAGNRAKKSFNDHYG